MEEKRRAKKEEVAQSKADARRQSSGRRVRGGRPPKPVGTLGMGQERGSRLPSSECGIACALTTGTAAGATLGIPATTRTTTTTTSGLSIETDSTISNLSGSAMPWTTSALGLFSGKERPTTRSASSSQITREGKLFPT